MPAEAAAEGVSSGATIALLLGTVVRLVTTYHNHSWERSACIDAAGSSLSGRPACCPCWYRAAARCHPISLPQHQTLPSSWLAQVTLVGLWFMASALLTRSLQRPSSGLRTTRRPSRQRLG